MKDKRGNEEQLVDDAAAELNQRPEAAGESAEEERLESALDEELMEEPLTDAPASADEAQSARLAALVEENHQLKDRLLRLAAEFDNYRKRSEREMQNYTTFANTDLMVRLLPALDELDRVVAAAQNNSDPQAIVESVGLLHKIMLKAFQDGGLQPMATVGEEFDPEFHDALLHIEVPGTEPNKVVEDHKKGYLFKGKVLRHAQVVVSK